MAAKQYFNTELKNAKWIKQGRGAGYGSFEGRIQIDGNDVNSLSKSHYRDSFAYILHIHLDDGNCRAINDALAKLSVTRVTSVTIAHKEETIRCCERVLQLTPKGIIDVTHEYHEQILSA